MVSFYCTKCKKSIEVQKTQPVKTKNGRQRLTGDCPECKTKVSKFVKAS